MTIRRKLLTLGAVTTVAAIGIAGYRRYALEAMPSPALVRKQQSERRLREMGVLINPSLPTLPLAWTQAIRSAREVAVRVMILRHVAGAATVQLDVPALMKWFKREGV